MMAAYRKFAQWYDSFMSDIPYGEWAEYIIDRLKKYGVVPDMIHDNKHSGSDINNRNTENDVILELGCGTGSMARYLCMEGYHVVGIDLSSDMIKEARKKIIPGFESYVGDMRIPFLEASSCGAVVSVCDSMNYLTSRSDMELTIKAVHSQLRDGGIFIFDMKTDSFYRDELGDNVFADRAGRVSYVWQNHYDEKTHINTYDITFYRRIFANICLSCSEKHRQRAYSVKQISDIAVKCGMELLEHTVRGERAYYILRK